MYVKDDKSAQRGAERLIDAYKFFEDIKKSGCFTRIEKILVSKILANQTPADAIPTDWIVKQIQDTSGAESSYYSRLLRKWRAENEH